MKHLAIYQSITIENCTDTFIRSNGNISLLFLYCAFVYWQCVIEWGGGGGQLITVFLFKSYL